MAFNSLICTYLDFHFDSQNSEFVVLTYFPKSPRGLFCELTIVESQNNYLKTFSGPQILSGNFYKASNLSGK